MPISSDSIQYMAKKPIKDSLEPLTVLELRDFLDRLIMGGCGNFKISIPASSFSGRASIHNYTLNGHHNTVNLDPTF